MNTTATLIVQRIGVAAYQSLLQPLTDRLLFPARLNA